MHTQHKSRAGGENEVFTLGNRNAKKKKRSHRGSIMSIPLMEIKVDVIDPTLFSSTIIKQSRLLSEKSGAHSDTQRSWMTYLVSPCGGFFFYFFWQPHLTCALSVFSCFTSYLSQSAAHFALCLWPPPPTPTLSVQFHLCRWHVGGVGMTSRLSIGLLRFSATAFALRVGAAMHGERVSSVCAPWF